MFKPSWKHKLNI